MKKINSQFLKNLELQNELQPQIVIQENILALDYGQKFCGLAFLENGVVLPLGVVPRDEILAVIQREITIRNIKKIIIGLPISDNGSENEICAEIRKFSENLETLVPFEFINERFSSQNTVFSEKNERIDDLAAAQILEFYLAKKH